MFFYFIKQLGTRHILTAYTSQTNFYDIYSFIIQFG